MGVPASSKPASGTLNGGISKIKIFRKKSRSPESVGQMSGQGADSTSPNIAADKQTKVSPPSGKFKVHVLKNTNRSPDFPRDSQKTDLTGKDENSGGALSKIFRVLKRSENSNSQQPQKKLIRFKRKSPSPPHSGSSALLLLQSAEKNGDMK